MRNIKLCGQDACKLTCKRFKQGEKTKFTPIEHQGKFYCEHRL